MELTLLLLGIGIALAIGVARWLFSASARASEKRREDLVAKRNAHQPWDGADGRANR